MKKIIIKSILVGIFLNLVSVTALASPMSSTYYVQIDLKDHTAFIFDKDFKKLPDSPENNKTSAIFFEKGQVRWFLGNDSDIVRRNQDGSIQKLSSDPAYSEMNHHMVFHYFRDIPQPPKRGKFKTLVKKGWGFLKEKSGVEKDKVDDAKEKHKNKVCGEFPFKDYESNSLNCHFMAPSSKFSNHRLPNGYGMKVNGGFIQSSDWRWDNPSGVSEDEKIYVRLVMHWDDFPTGFREIYAAQIVRDESKLSYCVEPGSSEIQGNEYEVNRSFRIVSLIPHIRDHGNYIELRSNGNSIHRSTPKKSSIPTKHSSCGHDSIDLHASKDHLPAGGLTPWSPGANGPTFKSGDKLRVFGSFSNPHDHPIDNMIILQIFWEDLDSSD
jgi:hypothetical protein